MLYLDKKIYHHSPKKSKQILKFKISVESWIYIIDYVGIQKSWIFFSYHLIDIKILKDETCQTSLQNYAPEWLDI
jgi:hypothetical protein